MKRVPKIFLYRLGSDPEFLYVRKADLDYIITPANTILGKDKNKTTKSFIGTDSRPVIAEIRPSPCRNLKRHMYDLAYALHTSQQYIDEKHSGLEMFAQPYLSNETLGGHIHMSGFIACPTYRKLASLGYTINKENNFHPLGGEQLTVTPSLQTEVINGLNTQQILSPYTWGQVINFMMKPFEFWIQPWVQRERRNQHYGGPSSNDNVRLGPSKAPWHSDHGAYIHWEYRMPSTWLQHPWLAYAYLGLFKWTVLNLRQVSEAYFDSNPGNKHEDQPMQPDPDFHNFHPIRGAENEKNYRQLRDRIQLMQNRNNILTPDITDLFKVIEQCGEMREAWFAQSKVIDVAAWRRLL